MSCWNNCNIPCYNQCYLPCYNQCYNPGYNQCYNPGYNPCNSVGCNPCCNTYKAIITGGSFTVNPIATTTATATITPSDQDCACSTYIWTGTLSSTITTGTTAGFSGTIRKTNNCKPKSIVVNVNIGGVTTPSILVTLPLTTTTPTISTVTTVTTSYTITVTKKCTSSDCGTITSYYTLDLIETIAV